MARKANPALIGAFVLGAIVLAVVGLVVFGGGKFFRQQQDFVAYFDESVKGLSIGSPITFNGVKIGAVTNILVVLDRADVKIWTPIFFEVEAHRFQDLAGHRIKFEKGAAGVQLLIDRGMRARLETQSFVTGQLALSLDFHPGTPIRLTGRRPDLIEMPTLPSSSEKIARTLEHLPVEEIVNSLQKALEGVDQLVNAPELMETIRELKPVLAQLGKTLDGTRETLKDAQKLVRNLDVRVGPVVTSAEKTLTTARATLEQAQDAIVSVNGLVSDGSPLQYELSVMLKELASAARSVRTLADYLDRHPDSLLFGKTSAGRK